MFTFKTLTDWITWKHGTTEDEWITWEEWQKHQQPSHYEKSPIFQHYLGKRPNFQPPQNSCLNGYNREFYVYCFGDFAALLVNARSGGDIIQYIGLLLDVYDVCKGRSRSITGDPNCIAVLRKVVLTQSLEFLKRYNFTSHCYPHKRLHAHTVVQYSLSTLIMRLVCHYLSQAAPKGYYPGISLPLCKQAYDECIFGSPVNMIVSNSSRLQSPLHSQSSLPSQNPLQVSAPININSHNSSNAYNIHNIGRIKRDEGTDIHKEGMVNHKEETTITTTKPIDIKPDDIHGYSWPRNPSKCLRCKICTRVCENFWGKFDACMDCHYKRICSMCGTAAVIITPDDNLPKCHEHSSK